MIIRGESNIIKIYDLTSLVDMENYDFSDARDIENFKESVASFLDAKEADAVNLPEDLIGIVPDGAEIEINGEVYTFEDVEYINKNINELISENFKEGDVVCLLQANGDGYFEYDENPDVKELKIGYSACDIELPDESVYDFFCDLMLPKIVKAGSRRLEVTASNFYPKSEAVAEVYEVREDGGVKYLQKLTQIDMLHFQWDEFEDIIQVDYDDPIA